ncbi:MAG TPA: metallopeptidase TldD-related protein [Terriglobia bacterium]|nr:metallopeptidase TldD-related protein [Terriglobia bacterium]
MKRVLAMVALLAAVSILTYSAYAQKSTPSPVRQALEQEMKRVFGLLQQKGDPAPYFISYSVRENESIEIETSLGALRSSQKDHSRLLDIDVRVGDYNLDNTHQLRGQRGANTSSPFSYPVLMPIDNDVDALRSVIWLETDRKYKAAVERFIQVKANRTIKVDEEDTSADMSRQKSETATLALASVDMNVANWEKKLKAFSAAFNKYPEVYEGTLSISANANNDYVVNSEGTSIQHGRASWRLSIYARTKADDGMDLYRFEAFDSHTMDRLPSDEKIRQTIEAMVADLKALRAAPVIDPFTGPAILSGRASGVFFHEIFGHRIEGHRQKSETEGQTFTKKVNQPILPDFISVVDDPTTERINEVDLNGYYKFDDDGVAAQKVTVVDKGILKNFLMSRSPISGFETSNGHGRKAPGYRTVGRQGNLIVQATNTVSDAKLRAMLIDEAKKQGKTFGLLFKDISGGFTLTGRSSPQSFQVTPIMVYRIYVDGRPDELVRGVDLIGTPLTSFSKIVAAGDTPEIFNGFCGAESGYVPVAAVSPSILTTQIEVQKKIKSSERPPILPPPMVRNGGQR